MAREEYCDHKELDFDIWVEVERVARRNGVNEAELLAEYDDHCVKWRV
jgi:hypothetical protein